MGFAVALPSKAAGSGTAQILIRLAEEKNAAFMRGDMVRWAEITTIAPDFTLMQPTGGPTTHGFVKSAERLTQLSHTFRNGETALEIEQTYETDSMVVLVMVERQTGEVGGLPRQDWSLRVTEVYRRDATEWQLIHRHADPLVHSVTLDQAAALARGLPRG